MILEFSMPKSNIQIIFSDQRESKRRQNMHNVISQKKMRIAKKLWEELNNPNNHKQVVTLINILEVIC